MRFGEHTTSTVGMKPLQSVNVDEYKQFQIVSCLQISNNSHDLSQTKSYKDKV